MELAFVRVDLDLLNSGESKDVILDRVSLVSFGLKLKCLWCEHAGLIDKSMEKECMEKYVSEVQSSLLDFTKSYILMFDPNIPLNSSKAILIFGVMSNQIENNIVVSASLSELYVNDERLYKQAYTKMREALNIRYSSLKDFKLIIKERDYYQNKNNVPV